MMLTLTVDCDNAAFDDDLRHELARILREAIWHIESGHYDGSYNANDDLIGFKTVSLRDANGNRVGSMELA